MNDPAQALAEIRSMMERSSKFLSLSGLAGISAGVAALLGAGAAYWRMQSGEADLSTFLLLDAAAVLVLAIGLAVLFTRRMAKKKGIPAWSNTTKYILEGLLIPLSIGGIFCIILWQSGNPVLIGLIGGATLLFYGLALINTSKFTAPEVRNFGFVETALGLLAAAMPEYWLIIWALGFGVLHIVYGAVVYMKYEK
ncbi:MAG TPA: hypothetical protein VFJ29_07870 [Candidatus Kapabacteria bacterium]|nr:hypothetical protein [Candidatus Kapabacteria bacterium]